MGKGKHKDYSKQNRKRYKDKFLKEYGMNHVEWCKWKKIHTKQEVHQKKTRGFTEKEIKKRGDG